jgi:predicted RNase H-like HicB family nuclease
MVSSRSVASEAGDRNKRGEGGSMEPKNVSLRVVIFKSGEWWVGQCLEHDIVAQAKTVNSLTYELERAIVAHIVIAEENGFQPVETIPPAPQRYWKMFEAAGVAVVPKEHRFEVHGRRQTVPMSELRLSEPESVPA